MSPDGTKALFICDWNLWVRDVVTGQERQLTTDGVKDFGYATSNAGWVTSAAPALSWSPDGKKIATQQQDERQVGDMYLVETPVNGGHPVLRAWKYPLPGDPVVAMISRVIVDVDTGTVAAVVGADVRRGAGVLERGVHLSLRRRLWCNGPPLAGNDSSVRRPCALSAFPMAFHLCADFFGRRLRGFFRVEPEGNCARGVYLGRLAWNDAQRRSRTCALPKGLALSLLDANCTNCHQFGDVEAKSWIHSCYFVTFASHAGDETGFGRCS